MTPWQYRMALAGYSDKLDREHDHKAWIMWHGAMLSGAKKPPPLKDFLSSSRKKPSQGINERDIMGRLKLYREKVRDNGTSSKTNSGSTR